MSFIKESKNAYKQVQENHIAIAMGKMLDDEGSMILNQLEELERAIEMIRTYIGADYEKQLPAWVQSKVTLGSDYISTVGNYLSSKNEKVTEQAIKEEFDLEETSLTAIHKMKEDGKTTEEIAKELKLNAGLVKKILGEQIELKEFTDAMLATLKKEYDPLKGQTISHSQYLQLKNILFKLKDGDLEKLQKQNIPFASTGAGSILRVRKSPVKITSVKVPGLEGMAEETLPVMSGSDSLGYNVKYKVKKSDQMISVFWSKEKNLAQKFLDDIKKTGGNGIITAKEEVDISKVTKYKMISIKGDQKEITIDREDLEKHLKLGYVIKEPLTEEVELQEKPSIKQYVVFHSDDSPTKHKDFKAYDETELNKQIGEFLKQNPGYKVYGKSPSQSVKETFKDNIVNKLIKPVQDYNKKAAEIKTIDMTDGSAHVRFPKDDTRAMEFYKSKGYKVTTKYEETEVTEVKEPTGDLKDACWTGYVAVGTKMKNGKRVPNCVPKSEAYKGAKAIVENAFKKLKEKK